MMSQMIEQIDKSLERFLNKILKDYSRPGVDPVLFASIKEFVLRKGKRIRPILLILSYKGYRSRQRRMSPSIYYVSTCVELLHNFMLIHDDIIDRSDLRRGKPTMHKLLSRSALTREQDKLGYDLAIIAGDIVYATAFDAFLSINEDRARKEEALKYFIQTAVFTAMGEFVDTLHGVQKINRVREQDVFLNYTLKTARYTFDCPLVVGAILAGADKNDIRALSEFGILIGQAFQIQDDVIGIFDSQKNIGKSILSDLSESKKTLLMCHAYRTLSGTRRAAFLKYFHKPKTTYADLVAIRKILIQAGSLHYSLEQIQKRIDKADKILNKLKMKTPYRRQLKKIVTQLFQHSHRVASHHQVSLH